MICRPVQSRSIASRLLAAVLPLLLAGWSIHFAAATARAADEAPPAPEDVNFETNDGLQMEATYYGSIKGKDAVPVILLHGWKGNRTDMEGLAIGLQQMGCAVIAPDLRGFGKSLTIKAPDGTTTTIDPAAVKTPVLGPMVKHDMQAVKKFLREKNNDGKLNLEKLCVVGADMGALLALSWAAYDLSAPLLPNYKQGQDVKALVLISPQMNLLGANATAALHDPLIVKANDPVLSILLIAGAKGPSKSWTDAQAIDKLFTRMRPNEPTDEKEIAKKDYFFVPLKDTNLQGATILKTRELLPPVAQAIAAFIQMRLVDNKDANLKWTMRKNPLEN
jgi:alpha-beta hydrolase superfamily lysophospholipase